MEVKSPLTKRPKFTKTTFNEICDDLYHLTQLRKNTGELIDRLMTSERKEIALYLGRMQVNLTNVATYTIPNVDEVLCNFKGLSKEHDETVKKICEHITLLKILEQKRNCPVAKVIDGI